MNPHCTPEAAEAARHEVLRTTVGSTVYGTGVGDQDDLDLMGICVEPPEYVVGLRPFEQWISRTQPEGVRSGPGDVDLVVYSARKWCRLALGGNPSVILPLFVPPADTLVITSHGEELRRMSHAFVSKSAGRAFLGYMTQQRERLTGERGGKHTNRPELIEKYGFDTKYAYHLLRLGYQGVEFMQTGRIQLPVPEPMRSDLVSVRTGGWRLDAVLAAARDYESRLKGLLAVSDVPERGNSAVAEAWLLSTYGEVWGWNG